MPCLVMGDSIAVGTAAVMPDCTAQVMIGVTSWRFAHAVMVHPVQADLVVISLGANDEGLPTLRTLRGLRKDITAARVVWLVPNSRRAGIRDAIATVAAENGDRTLDTTPYVGGDRLHPTMAGYRALAALARGAGRVAVSRNEADAARR